MARRQSPKDHRIDQLSAQVEDLKAQLQAEKNRNRSTKQMIAQCSHAGLSDLAGVFGANQDGTPRVFALVAALQFAAEQQDPMRSPAPSETGVVSKDKTTPVEAAFMKHNRDRQLVRMVGIDLDHWAQSIYNRWNEGPDSRPVVKRGKRCRNRDCDMFNKAWQKSPHCGWCLEPFEEAA